VHAHVCFFSSSVSGWLCCCHCFGEINLLISYFVSMSVPIFLRPFTYLINVNMPEVVSVEMGVAFHSCDRLMGLYCYQLGMVLL